MSTRRSFLKRQLVLSSSILLATSVDSFAKAAKFINVKSDTNTLNLLCSSDVLKLGALKQTIDNFEGRSINLFAGGIIGNQDLATLLYKIDKVNYHAANFSLAMPDMNLADLTEALKGANANFVNCNYAFENEALQKAVAPFVIVHSGKLKIGITGIGAKPIIGGITFKEPIASLNKMANYLKTQHHCDKVICLADLGFNPKQKLNNLNLAQASANVDFIIGAGQNPNQTTAWSYHNIDKKEVLVSANKIGEKYTNNLQFNTNNNQLLNFNTQNL